MASELKPFGYPVSWIRDAELLEVPPRARQLLEEYASIPRDDLIFHINSVRAKALDKYPYPCLGHYRFLNIALPRSPAYPLILSRLLTNTTTTLLDLGCCIGQELRHLAFSGVPASQLYGADICPDFFDVGFALFRDKEAFGGRFMEGDVFEIEGEEGTLAALKGKIDIIWTASVIHLWGWKKQVLALRAMLSLLDASEEPLLAGRMMGYSVAGEYAFVSGGKEESFYRHNAASFRELFREASRGFEGWDVEVEAPVWEENLKIRTGEEPGTRWDVEVKFVAQRKKVGN